MQIPEIDRIINKEWNLPDHTDKTLWDAVNFMLIWDKIVNGEYTIKASSWTTATRPVAPETGMEGLNTDTGGLADGSFCKEIYNSGWFVITGSWIEGSQPTDILAGSSGYNITLGLKEVWDGGSWQPLQS